MCTCLAATVEMENCLLMSMMRNLSCWLSWTIAVEWNIGNTHETKTAILA